LLTSVENQPNEDTPESAFLDELQAIPSLIPKTT